MASSSSQKKYDVFLSFRGEDSRDNFVSHPHKSLSNFKILTFLDNNLEKGEEISQSLLDAIEASRISLAIFSENYASSKWCFNELVKILECNERHGQIVIPVFYRVDPSDDRKQTGSYAMAFATHEQQINLDMVKTWRDALEKAANLAGWDSRVERPDTQLIEKIVKVVIDTSKKLNSVPSNHSNILVGIDSRIEKILSLLRLESLDVCILGISGVGGIGKTTMAIQIFESICNKFEEHYLLRNAKEELKQHVLTPWGHRLLPIILKERSLYPAFLGEQSHLKKVLAILDDVDDSIGLQELLREKEASFGLESRIILTSRDKHVLRVVADEIYEVEKLNHADALQLFNLHAFKTDVAEYAGGNRLALKVLGTTLFGKCRDDWESALKDLSQVSNRGILDVLRVSYDGLNDKEKKIFLYVAIFFRGEDEQLVKQISNSCFREVQIQFAMSRFVDKALVAENNKKLEMHNLLRELGKKIFTEESTNEIVTFNNLCDPHKIHHILMRKKATEAIEGITLDLREIEELFLDYDAFMGMDGLKVLQFYSSSSSFGQKSNVHLSCRGLEFISDKLRYLHWDGYPSKCLPVRFCAENLISLRLKESKVKQLWAGVQNVVNLKHIDLSSSKCLITLPDLSNAVNIEEINLCGCKSLEELPSSIQYLIKLEVLNLSVCGRLRSLPSRLDSPVLWKLDLTWSGKVKRCPKTSSGNLKFFSFEGAGIEEPPQSSINELVELYLWLCPNITKFPDGCKIGAEEWQQLLCLRSLGELRSRSCNLMEIPISFCSLMPRLESLDLSQNNFEILPPNFRQLSKLRNLKLNKCRRLRFLPELPESLIELEANDCESLETTSPGGRIQWRRLLLGNCCKLDRGARDKLVADTVTGFMSQHYHPKKNEVEPSFTLLPGTEIPDFFGSYRGKGSSITIKMPSNVDHYQLYRIAFCIVFASSSASAVLPSLKWKFVAPTPAEHKPIFDCELRCKCHVKDNTYEMGSLRLELGSFDPRQ